MTFLASLGLSDFAEAVAKLPPPGRAYPVSAGSVQQGFFGAISDGLYAVHARAVQLLEVEAFPGTAIETLSDWENDYGLPDPCTPADPTIAQRQATLSAKVIAQGGASVAYFTSVAAAMGIAITITQFTPFRAGAGHAGDPVMNAGWAFAWQVNAPSVHATYFQAGVGAAGEPLWSIDNSSLACRLTDIKPAHTVLLFSYG